MDSSQQYEHTALLYPSQSLHTNDHLAMNASLADSHWNSSHQSSSSSTSSSGQVSHLYSVIPRSAPDCEFSPSTGSATFAQHHQPNLYTSHHHSPASHSGSSDDSNSLNLTQVDSSIGPNRVLTRRQRAMLGHGGRRVATPSSLTRDNHDRIRTGPRHPSGYLLPHDSSRTQTTSPYPSHSERLSLSLHGLPMSLHSSRYSQTPISSSPTYSYSLYQPHSQSDSNSILNQRSSSPTLSAGSALTSVSSSGSGPNTQTFPAYPLPTSAISPIASRQKMKKQRLYNVDRKAICEYHKENPNARQEDIAQRYKVERSTISKILKHKTKWLNVPEEEEMRVAKHRPSKFPEVEEELLKWLIEARRTNTVLTDALIRANAKETARKLLIPEEKFKASSGWVENFKHRHGIRGGIWHGDGKNNRVARALGAGAMEPFAKSPDALSPLNPAFKGDDRTPSGDGEMDDGSDSTGSPSSESDHRRDGETDSSSVTLQPAWRSQSDTSASVESPTHSFIRPTQMQHSNSMDSTGDDDSSMSHHTVLHQHVSDHSDLGGHDDNTVYYPGLPPMPSDIPTLTDAEEALNKVIHFVDTTGQGILTGIEREHLANIKSVLFRAGSGLPYR